MSHLFWDLRLHHFFTESSPRLYSRTTRLRTIMRPNSPVRGVSFCPLLHPPGADGGHQKINLDDFQSKENRMQALLKKLTVVLGLFVFCSTFVPRVNAECGSLNPPTKGD